MAKMSNATGNWLKKDVLVDEQRVFIVTNAEFKESNDAAYDDSVNYTIQFIGSGEEAMFSMGINKAREQHIQHFADGGDPFDGINDQNGLVLFKGKGKKGNPPFLFRDATEAEIDAENERASTTTADEVPF